MKSKFYELLDSNNHGGVSVIHVSVYCVVFRMQSSTWEMRQGFLSLTIILAVVI